MNKMYLKRIKEDGSIPFRCKNKRIKSVMVLDKLKQINFTLYPYHTNDAIIVDKEYADMDACIFVEY